MTHNTTVASCQGRSKKPLGSSKSYGPTFTPSYEGGDGLLSNNVTLNPAFGSGYTYVYARYCDGASFAGDVAEPNNETGTPLYFRGHRVLLTLFKTLEERFGLGKASDAILAGCSAGGLATYIHCDEFADYARAAAVRAGRSASSVKTRCIADAGYFPDFKAIPSGQHIVATQYANVAALQNTTHHTNADCVAHAAPGEENYCFFPQATAPHLRTPMFALNSRIDSWQTKADWFAQAPSGSPWAECAGDITKCQGPQLAAVETFTKTYVDETLAPILDSSSPHGAFIDSCFEHCQSGHVSYNGARIKDMSIGEAIAAWYDGKPTKLVMAPYGTQEPGSSCVDPNE